MKIDSAIKDYIFSLSTSEGKAQNTITAYKIDLKHYLNYLNDNNIDQVEKINDKVIIMEKYAIQ